MQRHISLWRRMPTHIIKDFAMLCCKLRIKGMRHTDFFSQQICTLLASAWHVLQASPCFENANHCRLGALYQNVLCISAGLPSTPALASDAIVTGTSAAPALMPSPAEPARKRGRPKGSKNGSSAKSKVLPVRASFVMFQTHVFVTHRHAIYRHPLMSE